MSIARRTALGSLVAAVVLVAVKLVVGLASGSLGILAEAAHSGIDAVSAVLTLYAVGVAERPADRDHPYGHGKAQHLAALGEAVFLSGAAVWIAVEAVLRLQSGSSPINPRPYVFVVILFVLAVDATRTTVSLRTGRRQRNAALIANAWHFGSDFAGTVAVLVGLGLAAAGVPGGDSVAAIFVAVIVLIAAVRLGRGNVDVLMDRGAVGPDRPGRAGRAQRRRRGRGALGAGARGRGRELRRHRHRRLAPRWDREDARDLRPG